jgi:hypothetical protein
MLCQDEAVVLKSYRRIVREIRHQGSIYECTYKVTGILARMLPLYANDQIVKKNLLPFLYEVLNYQGINENKASYDELIDSIKRSTALIEQLATDADAEVAQCAQFLLSQVTA